MKLLPRLPVLAIALGLAAPVAVAPSDAAAHMIITSHETRHAADEIKDGPCGRDGGVRSENVHTLQAGSTITLTWDEFIPHPGYYRIAFDDSGDDDFVDPADYYDFATNDAVLMDNLFQHERDEVNGQWSVDVILPDIACDDCTLQLIQMMTDKPPYVVGTNDLYYNCLDLVLTREDGEDVGGVDAGTDSGSADTGSPDAESEPDAETADADNNSTIGDTSEAADEGTVPVPPGDEGCSVAGRFGSGAPTFFGLVMLTSLARIRRR